MSEFKLHHVVTELLRTLGNDSSSPEEFIEHLQSSMNTNKVNSGSHLTIQNHIQTLAQGSSNPQAFLTKFEDLKQKDVYSLGPYIQLLHQISQDSGVKDFLSKTCKTSPTSAYKSKSELTKDDLPSVKNRLKKAVNKKTPVVDVESKIMNKSTLPIPSIPSLTSWFQRRPTMSWDFTPTNQHGLNNSYGMNSQGFQNTGYQSTGFQSTGFQNTGHHNTGFQHTAHHAFTTSAGPMGNIPVASQEHILMDDILNVLMGLPGNYIEPKELKDPYDVREFAVSDAIDPSLKQLVKQILPLASYYSMAQRFVEEKMQFEYGQVNNALAEAIRTILVEYMTFVTQLETEGANSNLSMQKIWFYVQKHLHSLNILSNLITTINKSDARGGKVLSLLHEYVTDFIGEPKAQTLCVYLMEVASVPYMKMLGMWIYKGIISDPIREFLIEDNEVVQKEDMPLDYSADYWDKKYTIRRERIPKFLDPVADIILRAGKYLNVIRQCGKPLSSKIKLIPYRVNEEKHFIEEIEKAYKFASRTLLDLVLKEQDLLGRLKSVKHYFLLDKGDFIVTFLTLCEKELNKSVKDVIQARLDSLLDLALRLSSANNDPYKDDLKTEMLPYDLQFQMLKILSISTLAENDFWQSGEKMVLSVINSFSFGYEVRWPLSLILNRKSVACYQMIFRHLFYCKYVERMVCQVWRSNKVAKKFPHVAARQYRSAFALRQRMLHCVQNLEYHMMVEVVEPHWCTFVHNISKVNNVDEVLACHCDFLDSCLKDCMLTIPELLGTITKLLHICVGFCKFMQSEPVFHGNNHQQDESTTESTMESFEESISRYDMEFSAALMQLLDQINDLNRDTSDHDRLFNLLYRLDFNSFYSGQFEKMGFAKIKTDASG